MSDHCTNLYFQTLLFICFSLGRCLGLGGIKEMDLLFYIYITTTLFYAIEICKEFFKRNLAILF